MIQFLDRCVDPLIGQLKGTEVHRDAARRADVEVGLYRLGRVHVHRAHEPAGLVRPDRDQRQVDPGEAPPDLLEMCTVTRVSRKVQILGNEPKFAIVISSSGRGPGFYNGMDKDIHAIKHSYPDLPFIGFYGNGEICWLNDNNQLLEYATVFGLFNYNV